MEETYEAPTQLSEPPKLIKYEVDQGVAQITLNRPSANNVMNIEMLTEIAAALEIVDMNPSVKILVFKGNDTAFSSGIDITAHTQNQSYQLMDAFGEIIRRLLRLQLCSRGCQARSTRDQSRYISSGRRRCIPENHRAETYS